MSTELEEIMFQAKVARGEAARRESELMLSIPSIGHDIPDEARLVDMLENPTYESYHMFEDRLYLSQPKLSGEQIDYVKATLDSFLGALRLAKKLIGHSETNITVGDIRKIDLPMLDGLGLTMPQEGLMIRLFRKYARAPEGDFNLDIL